MIIVTSQVYVFSDIKICFISTAGRDRLLWPAISHGFAWLHFTPTFHLIFILSVILHISSLVILRWAGLMSSTEIRKIKASNKTDVASYNNTSSILIKIVSRVVLLILFLSKVTKIVRSTYKGLQGKKTKTGDVSYIK